MNAGSLMSTSLVVYGSTGRQVMLTAEDLTLPEEFKGTPWLEKQWDALRAIWITRVLHEAKLQKMTAPEIVQHMTDQLRTRWQQRKAEKQKYHAKVRAAKKTANDAPKENDNAAAGEPNKRPRETADDGDDQDDHRRRVQMYIAKGCGIRIKNITATFAEFEAAVEDIREDILEEMQHCGSVVSIRDSVLTKPDGAQEGVIDVLFEEPESARSAVEATRGRNFGGCILHSDILRHD